MIILMKSTCLSVCRQGWLGVPLFLLGVVSLAFSQLALEPQEEAMTAEELSRFVPDEIERLKLRVNGLQKEQSGVFLAQRKQAIGGNLARVSVVRGNSDPTVVRLQVNLQAVEEAWQSRSRETVKGLSSVEGRLLETTKIFEDLDENFAGRMDEAKPALGVLRENLSRTTNELDALVKLSQNAQSDALSGLNTLLSESNELVQLAVPEATLSPRPTIVARQPEARTTRFAPSIRSSVGQVGAAPINGGLDEDSQEVIRRLKNELAASKSVQTELSADTAGLQGDLRKAYREIVSLQSNLQESQLMVDELDNSRQSLWKTEDGSPPTAQTVSKQINRLEQDLQRGREDLRLSRQTLLLEQQRSNAMISSVTNELDRTRQELDSARTAAAASGDDSGRLLTMERELNQARRALQMAQSAPKDKTQETYLSLQDELRKALGEITRMQLELSEKDALEEQLGRLRDSIEASGDLSSGTARAEYVNKLLVDLNAAKREVVRARSENREERNSLIEKVAGLEDELQATKLDLEKTRRDFLKTREGIARREFEDALTIQRLEEEAELAQAALRDASLGKLPAIPFVNEMEENLATSEARIKILGERFESQQAKATEVIDGLRVELDAAILRQKRALDQLARREIDLQGKERELQQIEQEKRKLKEELEVVKVISSQLQDLNDILEKTKATQNSQSGSLDEIVKSLREELNQTKVELVFSLEDRDKIQRQSSSQIKALENQLENTRKKLLLKEEDLADLAGGSEELMLDLKSELDATREQISRMKRAGMGDSVETEKAISQLQEALGTIRILQESLDQSEQVNLEIDSLKSDLANAMETQIAEIQRSDDEKKQLRQKAKDLNAEIAMLREQRKGTGVGFQKLNAELREQLEASQSQIADLEKRAAKAEDLGVTSLVEIEEELAQSKNRSQELQAVLADELTGKTKTIELLEKDLTQALRRLDEMDGHKGDESPEVKDLKAQLAVAKEALDKANDTSTDVEPMARQVAKLEDSLRKALAELNEFDNKDDSRVKELERELAMTKIELDESKQRNFVMGDNSESVKSLKVQLEEALAKLEVIQKNPPKDDEKETLDDEMVTKLEKDLSDAVQSVTTLQVSLDAEEGKRLKLQDQLDVAMAKLEAMVIPEPESGGRAVMDFIKLEEELTTAQNTIAELQVKTEAERTGRADLENQLDLAMGKLSTFEGNHSSSPESEEVEQLTKLLAEKDGKQKDLEKQLNVAIESVNEMEAELELAKALAGEMDELKRKLDEAQNSPVVPPAPLSNDERLVLQGEIDLLKGEIDQLKKPVDVTKDSPPDSGKSEKFALLQEQLQNAVAESVEMETELEETKRRLVLIEAEAEGSPGQSSPELQKVISDAKNAEKQGQLRIAELTQALRESEGLRGEMEGLLPQIKIASPQPAPNIAADPRFVEIQKEMLLLQQDLLAARGMKDPEAGSLEAQLASTQADNAKLNEEFKNAMDDFGRIKEQLAILEDENQRLQNEGLGEARTKAEQDLAALQTKIGGLSSENSNLRVQLGERENRISGLRDELARAQVKIPGVMPDNAALRAQIIRLEGMTQSSQDGEGRAKMDYQRSQTDLQAANQRIASLEASLRQAESMARNLPSRMPSFVTPPPASVSPSTSSALSNAQIAELSSLREQNLRLQNQLQGMNSSSPVPGREQIDRKISTLNQRNLTAQIQLDQERARVEDLRKQLSEARDIKQEVLERGQSANLKVGLLNDELSGARQRISSLENALIAAREAIRVLNKTKDGSGIKVSVPSSFTPVSTTSSRRSSFSPSPSKPRPSYPSVARVSPQSTPFRGGSPLGGIVPRDSQITPFVQAVPKGDATLHLNAEVQFLNNKNRPAGFTEFFVLQQDLDSVLKSSRIRIPGGQGIDSFAELWARSVQRGYRYPGVAAAVRNALATASIARIKTNSVGKANLTKLKAGKYFVVGASTLGQVGVIWSKPFSLVPGSNDLTLDLRDAVWAE
jgi:DNA repair exonuclease SbcCD ATPase subunit